jgi:single-stranded DNA-binding protein
MRVSLEGPGKTSSWEDPNTGQKRYSYEVHAEKLDVLGK